MAPKLRSLQERWMANFRVTPPAAAFLAEFQTIPNAPLTPEQGLAIYRNNWRMGLIKALAKTYPVLERLLGKPFFQQMGSLYVEQYPSQSPSLNDYGAQLADFLSNDPVTTDLPYLSDVARLEWNIHQILSAETDKESPVFDWAALSQVPKDAYANLILNRIENSILLYSPYPVDRIWESNQEDNSAEGEIDLSEGEVYLFIRRSGFDLKIDRLTEGSWHVLNALEGSNTLGQLPDVLGDKAKDLEILAVLPNLIKGGYIANFSLTL